MAKPVFPTLVAGIALTCAFMGQPSAAHAQDTRSPTLDAVKQRGQLVCGVDSGIPGYAFQDAGGRWQGLDVALCRALADAVLGDRY